MTEVSGVTTVVATTGMTVMIALMTGMTATIAPMTSMNVTRGQDHALTLPVSIRLCIALNYSRTNSIVQFDIFSDEHN